MAAHPLRHLRAAWRWPASARYPAPWRTGPCRSRYSARARARTATKLRAPGARGNLAEVARKLARWAADRGALLNTDPPIPDALGDREGDIAVPLLAIADAAGGTWPARARAALLDLFGRRTGAESNMEAGALLLADLRTLFLGTSSTRMLSADIVTQLATMEERPWPEWKQGKPMTAPQLARALAPFGVRPGTVRIGTETAKGYYKETFDDAWARYLPAEDTLSAQEGGSEPSHRHNPGTTGVLGQSGAVTRLPDVTARNQPKVPENGRCDGVTAPGEGRRAGKHGRLPVTARAAALLAEVTAAGTRLEARLWWDAPDRLAPELRDALATERPAVLRLLLDGQAGEGGTATRTTEAEATAAPHPALPHPNDDLEHRAMLDGYRHAALRRPPSWTPASALPSPGCFCTCCAGQQWWCEREAPSGWRCATCYPPVHLAVEQVREVLT